MPNDREREMPRTFYLATMLATSLALTGCLAAPVAPAAGPDFSAVDTAISARVQAGEFPSAAYAVVHGGRIVHQNAVGWADRERQRATTVHTPYPLASVTKPIVATAMMALVEQGKLDLERRALDYSNGWTGSGPQDYTLRQLANHISGLGTYAWIQWTDLPRPLRTLRQSFEHYSFTAQPPGTMFEYSNLGYGLLGHILEQQSGSDLGNLLTATVFAPLGMRNSHLLNGYEPPPGAARKYAADGQPMAESRNDTPAAGNVYASIHDLALFAAFSLGHDPAGATPTVSREARLRMQSQADPAAQYPYYDGARYGLGWYFTQRDGERIVWHEGGMPGASTLVLLLPQRDLAVVVAINANDLNLQAQDIGNQLLATAAPGYAGQPLVATDGLAPYTDQDGWRGRWQGYVEVDGKKLPWTLQFEPRKPVQVSFRGATGGLPEQAQFQALVKGDMLLGTIAARLPGDDVHPGEGYILVRLRRDGSTLSGMAVAYASARRLEHLYPFSARLERLAGPKTR